MNVREAAESIRQRLSAQPLQCADPAMHARQLLQFALGLSTADLFRDDQRELSPVETERLERLVKRRCAGEPFQYLAGYEWFWKYPFEVGKGVLIPRKETELLVEAILNLPLPAQTRAWELGAGSGIIGICALRERPQWIWEGYEINPDSLPYLSTNVRGLLGTHSGYRLHPEDIFSAALPDNHFDLAASNPPYLVTKEMEVLSWEVKHEPRLALDGGPDGLSLIEKYFNLAARTLKPGGYALSEVGVHQGANLANRLSEKGWTEVVVIKDYAGIDRIVSARKRT